MEMIEILAGLHDMEKLGKAASTFRTAGLIGRQVARHYMRGVRGERAKVPSSTQVSCRIDDLRLSEEGIATGSKFRGGSLGVTAVAARDGIDEIASQAHELPVLALQVQ